MAEAVEPSIGGLRAGVACTQAKGISHGNYDFAGVIVSTRPRPAGL